MIDPNTQPADDRLRSQPSPGAASRASSAEESLSPALAAAQQAIERGDYGSVVRLLEPLAHQHPARTVKGAELRLLLATALMGQGQSDAAAEWCRNLQACQDLELRARGKALQAVLEAPALQRPRDWSITLPDLPLSGSLETLGTTTRNLRRSRKVAPPPPPPVGPTRAPLGFAALVGLLLLLLLLASLLGGCMEVRTDLRFAGPGRLQISHQLRSTSGTPTPWQQRLGDTLSHEGFRSSQSGGTTLLRTPVLPIEKARSALVATVQVAGALGGETLPEPVLVLEERNWLIGVRQRMLLDLDLRKLASLPGLNVSIALDSVKPQAVRRAEPEPVRVGPNRQVIWPLRVGSLNRIEAHCWRWSPLGLGATGIALLLPLVLGLQRLRRQLGFGLPELPA